MSDRRNGKIARLPFTVRTTVNEKLRDGVTYSSIILWLAEEGHQGINEQNLSNWKEGGHADWLREQERLADMQARREFAMKIVEENRGSSVHEANLHLVAGQIYEALSDFDLGGLKELLAEKPEHYAELVGAIAKMSKANVEVQKYKDAVAAALKICQEAKKDTGGGGLSAETIERIEKELKLL